LDSGAEMMPCSQGAPLNGTQSGQHGGMHKGLSESLNWCMPIGACTLSDRCSETRHAHQNTCTCTCTFHVSRALSSNVRCHYFHNNLNRARFLPSRCIPTHLSLPSFVQISKYYYYSFFPHRTRGQPANRAASSQPALPHRHHA
jgi:hypothetical protein